MLGFALRIASMGTATRRERTVREPDGGQDPLVFLFGTESLAMEIGIYRWRFFRVLGTTRVESVCVTVGGPKTANDVLDVSLFDTLCRAYPYEGFWSFVVIE